MIFWRSILFLLITLCACMAGCESKDDIKIGVSFGVGPAARWHLEQGYMKIRAAELGIPLETRFTTDPNPEVQIAHLRELIDSGVKALILIPRKTIVLHDIIEYAHQKGVKIINYARLIPNEPIDMFVGHNVRKMGQDLGEFLANRVTRGNYIILQGDPNDPNSKLLYENSLPPILALGDAVNIIMDTPVQGWSPDVAQARVEEALKSSDGKVDAILAPNDKLAGASLNALRNMGVTTPVTITGTDGDLDAARRIVNCTQAMTIYMDLETLARTAVDEAYLLAKGDPLEANATINNGYASNIAAHLINGIVVTRDNLNKYLIDSGHLSYDQVYTD